MGCNGFSSGLWLVFAVGLRVSGVIALGDFQPTGSREPSGSNEYMSHEYTSRSRQHLSPTQERILRELTNPKSTAESNAELARELHITVGAVRQHLHRMYAFYGVKSMRGLLRRSALHAAQISDNR